MTTNQKIERSREVRLWLTQIIAPVTIGTVIISKNPEARQWIKEKFNVVKGLPGKIKLKIKNRPRKGKIVGE